MTDVPLRDRLSEAPPNTTTRDQLLRAILGFLPGQDLLALAEIRSALEREIDEAGSHALVALNARLALDAGWGYARRIRSRGESIICWRIAS